MINVTHLNHSKTISHPHPTAPCSLWENCLPWNRSLVPKRLGRPWGCPDVPGRQGLWLEHILGGQNSTHNRVLHGLNFLDRGHYHIFLVRPRCGGWGGFWVPLQGAFCWHFLSTDISFLLSAGFPFCWHFTAPFPVTCSAPEPSSPTPSYVPQKWRWTHDSPAVHLGSHSASLSFSRRNMRMLV